MFFKSKPPAYVQHRGFLKKSKDSYLEEAMLIIYANGNMVVRKGEYTYMEAKPIEGNPARYTIVSEGDFTYTEFLIAE